MRQHPVKIASASFLGRAPVIILIVTLIRELCGTSQRLTSDALAVRRMAVISDVQQAIVARGLPVAQQFTVQAS